MEGTDETARPVAGVHRMLFWFAGCKGVVEHIDFPTLVEIWQTFAEEPTTAVAPVP